MSAFFDMFYSRVLREAKLEESISLKQGDFSVKEYSLKFTFLSKFAPRFVSNPRDMMNRFMREAQTSRRRISYGNAYR